MQQPQTSSSSSSRRGLVAVATALSLIAAACSTGSDDATPTEPADSEQPASTSAGTDDPTPDETAPDSADPDTTEPEPGDGETVDSEASSPPDDVRPAAAFPFLDPPTGEPITIGLVNTEGFPGLDFPEIRLDVTAGVDYLNQHGGFGGRPINLITCEAAGSPESSQACAQEITGQDADLVLLGLDLFPAYDTYAATDTPVVGAIPILPADYTADAFFLTGGNATIMSAVTWVAKNHYNAANVGIVTADIPASNASEATLIASLDLAGIEHTVIRGGANETDAGYQGLVREVAGNDPDLLISLYADAGCIGVMRGRASLGITTPVIATSTCATRAVFDAVGDDAVGWSFVGVASPATSPEVEILQEILAPVFEVEPEDVSVSEVGLGGVVLFVLMSLAVFANDLQATGSDVTARSVYDYLGNGEGLTLWPGAIEIDCGAAPASPSVCSFTFPFGEYVAGGEIQTIDGLEEVSSLEYLP